MGLEATFSVRRDAFGVSVSLSIADGRTLALLGPNGAGKSTVVEALAGTIGLADGRIELDGIAIQDVPPERRQIGVCFQDDLLFPHLDALENVAFPSRARRMGRVSARARARELLERLAPGIDPAARPRSLSGGERQRVALARALASEPRLLLLDEPFANVDVAARPALRALVRETAARFDGATIIVAHDPLDALTLADEVTILEGGRQTQTGTPQAIRSGPRSPYAAELVGVNLFTGPLRPLPDGAAVLNTGTGDLVVAPPAPIAAGTFAIATLRPTFISLHTESPRGSPRNVFRGPIEEVTVEGDRARVRVASSPFLTAEITTGSLERLGLRPGDQVWASFKAVEVSLHIEEEVPAPGTLGR